MNATKEINKIKIENNSNLNHQICHAKLNNKQKRIKIDKKQKADQMIDLNIHLYHSFTYHHVLCVNLLISFPPIISIPVYWLKE